MTKKRTNKSPKKPRLDTPRLVLDNPGGFWRLNHTTPKELVR